MHFGPEWMRPKGTARPAPSPPLTTSPAPPGNASYSALVTPATHPPPEGKDVAHPFRYSKEEMLRIYKEGGGRGGLGLEVERWEGIVREIGYDPVGLKEMSDAEKKVKFPALHSALGPCSTQCVSLRFFYSYTRARSTRKCVDASRRISYRPSPLRASGSVRSWHTLGRVPAALCGSGSAASWGGAGTAQVTSSLFALWV